MDPFEMFKLPDLPLKNVFSQLEPVDIATIAQCTKESKRKLQKYRYLYKKFTIRVFFVEEPFPVIQLFANDEQKRSIPIVVPGSNLSSQPLALAFFWIKLLMDMFISENTIEEIRLTNYPGDFLQVFDWAFKSDHTVLDFSLNMNHIRDADLNYFLDSRKVMRALVMRVYPSHEFQMLRVFNEKNICFDDARWLSPCNLPLVTSKRLILKNTHFTNDHVVQILRCWLNRLAFDNLRKLVLVGPNINVPAILPFFSHLRVGQEIVSHLPELVDPVYVSGAAIIKRDDGMIAVIMLFEPRVEPRHKQFRAYLIT